MKERESFVQIPLDVSILVVHQWIWQGAGGSSSSCMSQGSFRVFLYPILCVGRPLLEFPVIVIHGRVIRMP